MPKKKPETKKDLVRNINAGFFAIVVLFISLMVTADGPPYSVSWSIGDFYSDTYNITDLQFVWSGDTGTLPNPSSTLGSSNNGQFDTQYNDGGIKNLSVYATYQGGQVSDTVICSEDVSCGVCPEGYSCSNGFCYYDLDIYCAAYETEDAENPKIFFDPGSEVYWKATVPNSDESFIYNWGDDYNPSIVDGSGGQGSEFKTIGPFTVNDLGNIGSADYDAAQTYTTDLLVSDGIGFSTASCSIRTKQCQFNEDCITLGFPGSTVCDPATFVCVPPEPLFVEQLTIDPAVTNSGNQCGLAWAVDNVDYCTLKKDNTAVDLEGLGLNTSTTTEYMDVGGLDSGVLGVSPGTYSVECVQTATGESVYAGPVKCLYNPEVREQ